MVTGGAGYIGGVCVEKMIERGDEVIVVDSLVTGHMENLHPKAIFYKTEVGDTVGLDKVFKEHKIDVVLHFAGLIQVGESVREPAKYFQNNFSQAINLADVMLRNGVNKIIFSSTAATYGNPLSVPIRESDIQVPINPYGESKLFFEKALSRMAFSHELRYTIFRYFNACGATSRSRENHFPETHLIPLIFETINGKREALTVFGSDYPTSDGTCVRDYVHVSDLIDAHLLAIDKMNKYEREDFNLGNGGGYSVKEVISAVEKVTGKKVPVIYGERRVGDPAQLMASSEKARNILGWMPKFAKIEDIIKSAWEAEKRQ